jgi:hypothetical protein
MSGRGSWDIVGLCGNIREWYGMERVGDSSHRTVALLLLPVLVLRWHSPRREI